MKRLNKKGFTLVELLAVIVVLAIIMVIATRTIGNVIAGARGDSYVSTVKMIAKGAEAACTTDGDLAKLNGHVEFADVTVKVTTSSTIVEISPKTGGKFVNMDTSKLTGFSSKFSVSGTTVKYTASCKPTANKTW